MVAKVGALLVYNPLCHNLLAIIIGMMIIELALPATSKVPGTLWAYITLHQLRINVEFVSAKGTLHCFFLHL